MLTKIEITNFKSFNKKFTFDLSDTNEFKFNEECIKDGIVNKVLVYGHNGCGKSNLGFAIFDIISHLTDREFISDNYKNYFNANSDSKYVTFNFEFKFDNSIVQYTYTKSDYQTLISEELIINNVEFAYIDKSKSTVFRTTAKGAETLKSDLNDSTISILSYISKNALLEKNDTNKIFEIFKEFIHGMLYFRSLDGNSYMGYEQGAHDIDHGIVKKGNLKNFETFLNDAGIICDLITNEINGIHKIFFKFINKEIEFFSIASSGTKALAAFYFFYQRLKNDNVKFLFIDEFDAFYHHDLSRLIIEKLKEITGTQIILTTHNTSIISNDLLRPDCYFLMDEEKIRPLTKCTDRELREGHNIEKMYRANSFE